jgi:iron complex outermembrane recepter protein
VRNPVLLVTLPFLAASPALAEGAPQADHVEAKRDIIVTAPYTRARGDVLSGTSVITGDELTAALRPSIGETLARQPGVSATSFGPTASRPVLRGFQGERIRVLTDGIGSIDVSNTSVDHPVAINPLTADRIEVLRGPAALLFGSSAIGGVVNVIDSRIPRRVPTEAFHLDGIASYGSAANERSGGGEFDLPLGKFVLHVDGSYSKTGDLRTGGFILSPALRAQAAATADPAIAGLAGLRGDLPNSASRTWDVAGGASYIDDGGSIGFAVSRYKSLYGIPVRFSLDPDVEAEQVRIDATQTRVDARAEINTGGGVLDKIRFRGSFADYAHNEVEEDGSIATTFLNKGWEGRLEFVQAARGGWQGASGAQFAIRNFDVIGDEAFVPKNETNTLGLFTLQSIDLGRFKGEIGARYERTRVASEVNAVIGNEALTRRFSAISGSIGASYEIFAPVRLGLSFSHTERAPSAEELFANGPHAGTQAFEIGNPDFRVERSDSVEASLRAKGDGYEVSLAAYYSRFKNFIYEDQAGAVIDDLPVFQFRQADADYWGVEGEISVKLVDTGSFTINVDALGDYTRATIKEPGGNAPAPRIPALRLLGGIEAMSNAVDARIETEWVNRQSRVAAFETTTAGYTMVNASLTWRPFGKGQGTSLVLSANNIFDVEARRHASVLKDYAPLAGRDLRLSVRFAI